MILNRIIFGILVLEAFVCLILLLPFGKRFCQQIVKGVSAAVGGPNSQIYQIGNVALAIIVCLFLANVHTCWKHQNTGDVLSDGMRIRLLVAQRDMYLSGMALFLFVLLKMLYSSLEANIKLEKSLEAMQKQAKGASAAYNSCLEDQQKLEKQMKKLSELSSGDGDDDSKTGEKKPMLSKLLEQNAELEVSMEKAEKELKTARSQLDAVKKQAGSQGDAFMKLLEEKTMVEQKLADSEKVREKLVDENTKVSALKDEIRALKKQVEDYDFMFGDKKKKEQ